MGSPWAGHENPLFTVYSKGTDDISEDNTHTPDPAILRDRLQKSCFLFPIPIGLDWTPSPLPMALIGQFSSTSWPDPSTFLYKIHQYPSPT
jgi:hypothetical protein